MALPERGGTRSGAEDYPYDPNLSAAGLCGLDRLRTVADRKLAQYLYQLHGLAERNTGSQSRDSKAPASTASLRELANRARMGELGSDARELAEYLLVDDGGRPRYDDIALRTFARNFRRLRAEP